MTATLLRPQDDVRAPDRLPDDWDEGPGGEPAPRRRSVVPTAKQVRRGVLAGAAVALLAVEAVLVGPSLSGAATAVLQARPVWLVLAVVAAAASMSMFALSRRRLMRAAGVRVTVRGSVAAVFVANALHVTLPGGAAFSTAYTYRWMRNSGASRPVATWTLASGGLVATASLAGLGLLGSSLVGSGAGLTSLGLGIAGIVVLALTVRHLVRSPGTALAAGRWVMRWVNMLRRRPPTTGDEAVHEMVSQLAAVRPGGRDWFVSFVFAAANWAFDAGCLAASAAALGVHGLTLPLLLLAYTAGMAAAGLSLLPGGLGVVDAALVLTLVGGGIPTTSALSAVLLYRLISLVGVVSVGWVVAAARGLSPRHADHHELVVLGHDCAHMHLSCLPDRCIGAQ